MPSTGRNEKSPPTINSSPIGIRAQRASAWRRLRMMRAKSLFECAISRIYADSAVSALGLEQALACKTGCPLLARSLWARFRQPRQQGFFGQDIGIPHSNRLSVFRMGVGAKLLPWAWAAPRWGV